jgi:hypothetical protein
LEDIPVDKLRAILTYHVIPGRRKEASIVNANQVPTLNGAKVKVDGTNLNGDQADIVATNIEASNGIIHVIDGVLLPGADEDDDEEEEDEEEEEEEYEGEEEYEEEEDEEEYEEDDD